jgi:ferrous iron transport protein B
METEKDRLLTVAMAPFMSCGARLSVYALFAAAFFAKDGQNIVFLLYFTGIAMAVLTGFILKKTLFATSLTPFVMEMPTYHIPSISSIVHKTWHRLKSFIKRAGKTIVIVFIVLKMLSTIGLDGSVGNDDTENSLLSTIGQAITPIFEPIGVQQDNWPATVGIFTGVFAKEAVVGTLDALYSSTIDLPEGDATTDASPTLSESLLSAWETIPANLNDLLHNLGDPLGLSSADIKSVESAAEEQEVNISTFTAMVTLFGSELAAFSYLVFVLLYTPCVAVMGAMLRESGVRWMAFVSIWSTGLAYITASVVYQVGSFNQHPEFSTWWLIGCAVVSIAAFIAMRIYGSQLRKNSLLIPVVNIH